MNFLTLKIDGVCRVILFLLLALPAYTKAQQALPSLIPLPQSLQWTKDAFPLNRCEAIFINDEQLQNEVGSWLKMIGIDLPVKYGTGPGDGHFIQVSIGEISSPSGQKEAYHLAVKNNIVTLTANTQHGIFNGLQTLYQLAGAGKVIPGCDIKDYPAYGWRGYMVDVGRNYQSPEQLKQQIDIMSRYKLNVFHFHLTEDVAWRLQVKGYPQLTSPESMLRDKGKFYTVEQIEDLIRYCRERFITFVPEIDMPGHSAAFTRAMGTDMQSDSGLSIVKDILREVCTTYDVPFIHIGADEVEIKNKQFLPEVTRLIQSCGRQVIGWAPGGNYNDSTIRQLWKEEGKEDTRKDFVKYIDSRFLYLSDMDPQNCVVSIFGRQLGERTQGDSNLLGAEICLWDDRRVEQERDHLIMNAVYPGILAFGERSWRGGGYPEVAYYIGPDSSARAKDFAAFEKRLIDHKKTYFTRLPFPYVRQTQLRWKLFGPFNNNGNLNASYWPEKAEVSLEDSAAAIHATGGTIWLWQTYAPQVQAWLPSPRINTTWYAFTRFWSDADTTIALWIEFKNLSRSGADATPPAGQWDYKKSKIWINRQLIPPPKWKYPGRPAGKLEEPLVDEGYYYRPPHKVNVRKGWNQLLVKLPLDTFDLEDWQQPAKWMFTVIPVHKGQGVNWYANDVDFY